MKLSGHSYDNDVFGSLLDGICKDVTLKKTAQSNVPKASITGMDLFSSTTEDTLSQIQGEELEAIAGELSFAADRAKVAVSRDDLAIFAKRAMQENLRGKALERAAQRFCNDLSRITSEPQRQSVLGSTPIDQQSGHQIISATYDPGKSVNTTSEGKFMGCSKNPNTIWDNDALQRFAQIKHGDEQIKESKEAQEKFAEQQKREHWESLQKQGSDPSVLGKGIVNAGTSDAEEVVNCNLKKNAMSIFSNNRDFENIPMETDGEKIAKLAEERAQKAAQAKEEWNQIKPMPKLNNAGLFDKLFK